MVAEFVGPMPYPALNSAFDALVPPGCSTTGRRTSSRSSPTTAIDAYLMYGSRVPVVNSTMHIYPINGAVHRVPADDTAFAYRDANFATVIAGMWPDPATTTRTRRGFATLRGDGPALEEAGYINFMAGDDQDRIKANYGGTTIGSSR